MFVYVASFSVVFLLLPRQEGTSGKTALHLAVELHDVTSVKMLLSRGADVDAAMYNGCTPLHLAVGRQDTAIANILCQSGADTMLRNMEDETALDLADGNDDVSRNDFYNYGKLIWKECLLKLFFIIGSFYLFYSLLS